MTSSCTLNTSSYINITLTYLCEIIWFKSTISYLKSAFIKFYLRPYYNSVLILNLKLTVCKLYYWRNQSNQIRVFSIYMFPIVWCKVINKWAICNLEWYHLRKWYSTTKCSMIVTKYWVLNCHIGKITYIYGSSLNSPTIHKQWVSYYCLWFIYIYQASNCLIFRLIYLKCALIKC